MTQTIYLTRHGKITSKDDRLIKAYENRLTNLYIRLQQLEDEDLSEAQEKRKKGMSNWDSYGHDEICWRNRNLRKTTIEISFLEKAIPRLKEGLTINDLVEQFDAQTEKYHAEDHRIPINPKKKAIVNNTYIRKDYFNN